MDEVTMSQMADMIIVFGGCGALCGLVGGIVANGICLLIDGQRCGVMGTYPLSMA